MDSTTTTPKLYHVHGMDSRSHLDMYFSNKEDMVFAEDSIKFPMANLYYQLSTGRLEGTFLIDISFGSIIHQLFSASNTFKYIVILKFQERCIMELTRWLHDRTGAYDWSHTSSAAAEFEGTSDQEKEMHLKSSIKQILKCDFKQENITSPVLLPLADCIVSAWILEAISKNEDDYMRNLEKILKLLKPGGQLVLIGMLDATYGIVGEERINFFKYNEDFVKNAFGKVGLVIDYCAVQRRRNVSDLVDYSAIIFLVGRKGE
ncbi:nicotinamide N-methyltransferase-like [Rana temporaria]|uniref:nicotinamide N-methyltransferase-like n=1 Tax=Rana temporaria TaxID=8407 RepID=UPI001AAD702E|nr:nicotinamide N-methyltransferase-like [Rana temporaria]